MKIRKEIVLDAAIEDVWQAVTDRGALSSWYMQTDDFEPVIGCKFVFTDKPQGKWDGKVLGEVLEADAPNRLVYTFTGNQMDDVTTVSWTLRSEGSRTRVVIEHTGFSGFGGWLMGSIIKLGWRKFLKRLRAHVDQH